MTLLQRIYKFPGNIQRADSIISDMAVSADHSTTERVIIHDYCAQHAQEIDGSRCWEPVYNAIIEASMTSKLTLIGIVKFLLSAISIFREATFSNGNSPELARLGDDGKFARTHV